MKFMITCKVVLEVKHTYIIEEPRFKAAEVYLIGKRSRQASYTHRRESNLMEQKSLNQVSPQNKMETARQPGTVSKGESQHESNVHAEHSTELVAPN